MTTCLRQEQLSRVKAAQLKPVLITDVDFSLAYVYGIVELLSNGVVEEEDPGTGTDLKAGPEAHGGIAGELTFQVGFIIAAIEKEKEG